MNKLFAICLPKIKDNLTYFLYGAIILHLFIILGFNFTNLPIVKLRQKPNVAVDVILVNNPTQDNPEKALLAANRQRLGKITDKKSKVATKDDRYSLKPQKIKPEHQVDKLLDKMANLKQEALKNLQKITISAATHATEDAQYLVRWQQYIEKLGNNFYPKQALKNNITGNLRLLVAINKDGSVKNISLRQSSGHQTLDDAAINIVLKAAPFEPLPQQLTQKFEVLEIIRTWQFKGTLSTTG